MTEKTDRFYVPSRPTIIEGFRALRAALEKVVEARGGTLDPAWYDDGPERFPQLYKDQPELLKHTPTDGEVK
jgi:hypothetical protein